MKKEFWKERVDQRWCWDENLWELPSGLRDMHFHCFDEYDRDVQRQRRKKHRAEREARRLAERRKNQDRYSLRTNTHPTSEAPKVLKLTLKRGPFEATVAGEKKVELREDSAWIRSRLYTSRQCDSMVQYDYIEYYQSRGFFSWCPMVRVEFVKAYWSPPNESVGPYSNGLKATFTGGCWVIRQGNVVHSRNLIS